jgi:hypothetical protein
MKKLWKKIKHWCCKVGLCNLDKCVCDCHEQPKGRSKAYYKTTTPPPLKAKASTPEKAPKKKNRSWRDGPTPN